MKTKTLKVPREEVATIGRGLFVCIQCPRRHSRTRADGSPQSYCRRCHAAYMRERRALQRKPTIIEISITVREHDSQPVSIYKQTIAARSYQLEDNHGKKMLD